LTRTSAKVLAAGGKEVRQHSTITTVAHIALLPREAPLSLQISDTENSVPPQVSSASVRGPHPSFIY